MRFLVAYDIADPARLQRVARRMERSALRCQKSVFLFEGTDAQIDQLLDDLVPLLEPAEDVVQAWQLSPGPAGPRTRGTPLPVLPAGVVLGDRQRLFIDRSVP